MEIDKILTDLTKGEISLLEAKKRLSLAWIETIDHQIIDINRKFRINIPEVIYGEYKTLEQTIAVTEKTLSLNSPVMVSRSRFNIELKAYFENKTEVIAGERILVLGALPKPETNVLVLSGGSSDHPVVEEIEFALKALGVNPIVFEDRGIAHPGRVLEAIRQGLLDDVRCVIVVAGMEASLATFVSALVPLPVIGVPTPFGYGYKAGETALISMLSACTPNLAVVNIDGGIRAAVLAYLIGAKK